MTRLPSPKSLTRLSSGWTATRVPPRTTLTPRKRKSKVLLVHFSKRWPQPLAVPVEACPVVCREACPVECQGGCRVVCPEECQGACPVGLVVLALLQQQVLARLMR